MLMKIKVNVFSANLLRAMRNPPAVEAEGETVGQCLNDLIRQYPDVAGLILDKAGRLRREVYVYVNAESLHKAEMTRPLKPGDALILAVLVTGG
jgi:molybdopterin converting factor small subunit